MLMPKNRRKTLVFITVFFIIIFYQWFFTAGKMVTPWPRDKSYYDLQSRAFLQGQLHLLELPRSELLTLSNPYDPSLNRGLTPLNDLTLYHGKYYLNWGPVPALIVSLIHLVFTSKPIYDSFIVFGFLCGLLISNTLLIRLLSEHLFTKIPEWSVILAVLLIGLSHPIPWLLGRPAVYEAAITGGQFFLLSGLYWAISALENSRPKLWRLFLAGTSWALVVGTRISLLVTVLFFTVPFIYIIFRQAQKNGWSNIYRLAIGCIIGPVLLTFLLLGFYNYSRFNSFFETGVQYTLTGGLNQRLLAQEGKLVSREYVLPNLMNYIGNGIGLKPVFPYLVALPGDSPANQIPNFNYRLEVLAGILWVLPFTLFSLMPITKFLGFIFQKIISRNRDLLGLIRSDAGLLKTYIPFLFGGGALFAFLPLLTFFGATMRYQEDFVPLLMLLSIWGFWSRFEKYYQGVNLQRSIIMIGSILAFASITISFLLGITSYYGYFEFHNPDLIYRIRNSLAVKSPLFLAYDSEAYDKQADLIWQSKNVILWRWYDESRAYLIGVKNPNGLDILKDGRRFYWLGSGPSHFELIASRNGLVELSLDTIQGPSLPDVQERHLHIVLPNGGEIFQTVLPGIITFSIPVKPGKNTLLIEILDKPSLHILPSGDTRPLLLGIQGINIQWSK